MAALSSLALAATVIGGTAAVVGTVGQIKEGRKQTGIANRQAQLERRRTSLSNIRQAQVTRARSVISAQGAGTGASSGALGGIGAISSQLGSAQGYGSQQGGLQTLFNRSQARQANWGAVAGLGGKLFSAGFNSGGGQAIKDSFQGGSLNVDANSTAGRAAFGSGAWF